MTPQSWFLKELECIDPSYRVVYNEMYRYYEIKKDLDIYRTDKVNGKTVRLKNPTVAVFHVLNDDALESLRRRKRVGLKYHQNSLAYLEDIKRQNNEAKRKAKELAREQQAEGWMRAYNWGKKKYFDTPRSTA